MPTYTFRGPVKATVTTGTGAGILEVLTALPALAFAAGAVWFAVQYAVVIAALLGFLAVVTVTACVLLRIYGPRLANYRCYRVAPPARTQAVRAVVLPPLPAQQRQAIAPPAPARIPYVLRDVVPAPRQEHS